MGGDGLVEVQGLTPPGSLWADGTNTTLLSRVKGRALARKMTSLPSDSLLDCVYDKAKGVLWVLDLVKWSGHWLVECEAEMR